MNVAVLFAVTAEALSLALGHITTGLNYYRTGQHDKAIWEFNVVLRDFGDTPVADDALYWSAQTWEAAGQSAKADAARAELGKRFPHSPYVSGKTAPVAVAPAPVPVAPAPGPVAPPPTPPSPPPPPKATGAKLVIRNVRGQTVAVLNDKSYASAADLAGALAALKKSQPNAVVTFEREADVDLQMVVDAINALDQAGLAYKLP